ncbi:MAG: nucleoside 2-deoxyribosyltransferase [Anaerolineales bacterium]
MLIYFAAPLFCQAERDFNLKLTTKLEEAGFSVFLPQRDGVELSKDFLRGKTEKAICQAIFNLDRSKILESDIVIFILDGRVPDEGLGVELGIAHENKFLKDQEKLLIGYSTDMRVFAKVFKVNAMLFGALDDLVSNENDLIEKIRTFQKAQAR